MFDTIDRSIIVELQDQLGPTIVAMISGNRDRNIVEKWLSGSVSTSPDENRRLSFALEQFRCVADAEQNADSARSWFVGSSVAGGLTPAMAIRDDNFDDVIASATRLVQGTWE